jgi:hypothetical protein
MVMNCSDELQKIWDELEKKAYNISSNNNPYKKTNQMVRN